MMDYDLFSRRFKADPFPTFAQMRSESPIYCHIAPNGLRIWYVTRYDDVVEILNDGDRYVKNMQNAADPGQTHSKSATQNILQLINQNMLFADPPDSGVSDRRTQGSSGAGQATKNVKAKGRLL